MTWTCPICFENKEKPPRKVCDTCKDGGICHSCACETDETKCPVCRITQWKWIYQDIMDYFIENVYDTPEERPCVGIFITNVNTYGNELMDWRTGYGDDDYE